MKEATLASRLRDTQLDIGEVVCTLRVLFGAMQSVEMECDDGMHAINLVASRLQTLREKLDMEVLELEASEEEGAK